MYNCNATDETHSYIYQYIHIYLSICIQQPQIEKKRKEEESKIHQIEQPFKQLVSIKEI